MTHMKVVYKGDLHTEARHESGAVIETDAPKDIQGKGECFSPTDLFAVSLPSCMLTLMGIHAGKLGVDLKGATAEVEKEMSVNGPRRISKLIVRIRCPHQVNREAQAALEQKALACPVYASLHPDIKLEIDFIWGV
jgi:putative redox protein